MPLHGEKMNYRLPSILIMLVTITACVPVPPPHLGYCNPRIQDGVAQTEHVAIVADVCVIREVLGNTGYVVVDESRKAERDMLTSAKDYMERKGYEVSYARAPFVGASMNSEELIKSCYTKGEEVLAQYPPLYETGRIERDPLLREALLEIIPQLAASQSSGAHLPTDCCTSPEMQDYMRTIAENTGGDITLFLFGNGTVVSEGRQMIQAVTTGLMTAVLSHGTQSTASWSLPFLDSYAVLVDNTTGEILWTNRGRTPAAPPSNKPNFILANWPEVILYHLPGKEKGMTITEQSIPAPPSDMPVNVE